MDIENGGQLTQPRCNLLPSSLIPEKPPTSLSRFNTFLLTVNLVLLAALAATHLMGLASAQDRLQTKMETAKLKAEATLKIREKADKLKEEAEFLSNLKKDTVPKIAILEELTQIFPDETWLDRGILEENRIQLYGLSSEASNLLSEIEKSQMFENVSFQAPVVQEKRFGKERFQISADLSAASDNGN
jgi:general secretion pathway protein L